MLQLSFTELTGRIVRCKLGPQKKNCVCGWPAFSSRTLALAYVTTPHQLTTRSVPGCSLEQAVGHLRYYVGPSEPPDECLNSSYKYNTAVALLSLFPFTRVGTLIVATIYLQLIQNRYMFRSFTVLKCSHQHCV